MINWESIIGKIPQVKILCDWLHRKVRDKLLGRKSLTLTLNWQPSDNKELSFTSLAVSNNCNKYVTFLYANYDVEVRTLPLYREVGWRTYPNKNLSPEIFKITPLPKDLVQTKYVGGQRVVNSDTIFHKRDETDMFYFAAGAREVFRIPNTKEWVEFLTSADRLFLLDSEGTKFYVDTGSIKAVKKQIKRERDNQHS